MIAQLKNLWRDKPLVVILAIAMILRLLAVIFAKGFGMHDDHFLVIEPAQAWVDGIDNDGWLPMFRKDATPSGHSLFFPGLHYLLFYTLNYLGVTNPQTKMFVVRLILAACSMLTVLWGYRLAERIGGEKLARQSGLLLAALWIFPNLSVRNLVEVFCIPFLLFGVLQIYRKDLSKLTILNYVIAGFVMGIAFSIRFQTITFAAGFGLGLLLMRQFKGGVLFGIGYIFSVVLIQGGTDICIWGYPFAEFREYSRYNMTHANDYITQAWYHYIVFLLGILIPPLSLALFAGFLKSWKKHLLIFLPVILFIAFHSFYPNKQERFILPTLPFIIILGIAGWHEIEENSAFWKRKAVLLRNCWVFFWILNLILLVPVTLMYSKKARVESMCYLSRYKNIKLLVNEDSNHGDAKMLPRFYLGLWPKIIGITKDSPIIETKSDPDSTLTNADFVLFAEEQNLAARLSKMQKTVPALVYETTIKPGMIDALLYKMNPNNTNQTLYIYRNTHKHPVKISLP
ncbi:MAG: glycosyltransferase family 39 protein [Bacteroidota bacterium]